MNAIDRVEFQIQVSVTDAADEELDRVTRQLLFELRGINVESINLVKKDFTPTGTKSADAVTVGAIALVVLPTLLPKILEVLQDWRLRANNRTFKFKGKIGNHVVEFEGSSEDLEKLLKTLSKEGKRK